MTAINIALDTLLAPAELNVEEVATLLNYASGQNINAADLYFQYLHEESWGLEEGSVKSGSFHINKGFGCRIISGEKSGFAYADTINKKTLKEAISSARQIVAQGKQGKVAIVTAKSVNPLYPCINPLSSCKDQEKVDLLREIDTYARRQDPRIQQVIANLHAQYEIVLIMDLEGLLVADIRPLVSLSVVAIAEEKGNRQKGLGGGGSRLDYHYFFDKNHYLTYVDKAVNQALSLLKAIPAPAGPMPVVLGPGWPAVLLHESVGHALEADVNRKGSSIFSNKMGDRIAAPLCTVVDDGTLPNRRGSITIDDEGTPSQRTVLIEKGILKNYLQDKHNALLMGVQSTGNGRRESYSYLPIPRMTNTCLLPGESDPEELLASVEKGLYAVDFAGGQVDPTTGQFVFSASEAYLIEKGKITQPVRGATLLGNCADVLTKILKVGNDFKMDSGIGSCGKGGQSVPVGVGQPSVLLEELIVGGTSQD